MSSLVLLNKDGTFAHRLQLVSLPEDYVVPEGMIVSWREAFRLASLVTIMMSPPEPPVAFFYLGCAVGEVDCGGFEQCGYDDLAHQRYFSARTLTVTVQGASAPEVMRLRDYIVSLIRSGAKYGVSNDLNPKPKKKFLRKHKK